MSRMKLAYAIHGSFAKRANAAGASRLQKALMASGLMGTAGLGVKAHSLANQLAESGAALSASESKSLGLGAQLNALKHNVANTLNPKLVEYSEAMKKNRELYDSLYGTYSKSVKNYNELVNKHNNVLGQNSSLSNKLEEVLSKNKSLEEQLYDPHVQAFIGTKQHAGSIFDNLVEGIKSIGVNPSGVQKF